MKPFRTHYPQVSLLYSLRLELLKHSDNLQRALDGKSAFYLPNSRQRARIETEQDHIASMLLGVSMLGDYWRNEGAWRKPNALSLAEYTTLRGGTSLAYMQTAFCQLKFIHVHDEAEGQQGLQDLFRYFDSKVGAADILSPTYYTYDTLPETVGYTAHSR